MALKLLSRKRMPVVPVRPVPSPQASTMDFVASFAGLNIDGLVDFVIQTMQFTLENEQQTATDPVLQNKVCTVPLGTDEINVSRIETESVNHKYKKKEFPAHTTRNKRWTTLVFRKAKLVINNVRSDEQMYYAIAESFRFLRGIGAVTKYHFLSIARTNNNVLTGNAVDAKAERCTVDLAVLARHTTRAEYDPELFPSASIAFAGFLHQLDMKTAVADIVRNYFNFTDEQRWKIVTGSAMMSLETPVAPAGAPTATDESTSASSCGNDWFRHITCLPMRAALQGIIYQQSNDANASIKSILSETAIVTVLGAKTLYEAYDAFYFNMRLMHPYLQRDTDPRYRNARHQRRIEQYHAVSGTYKALAPAVPEAVLGHIMAAEAQRAPNDPHVWNIARSSFLTLEPATYVTDVMAATEDATKLQQETRNPKRLREDSIDCYATAMERGNSVLDLTFGEPVLKRHARDSIVNQFNPSGGVYGGVVTAGGARIRR